MSCGFVTHPKTVYFFYLDEVLSFSFVFIWNKVIYQACFQVMQRNHFCMFCHCYRHLTIIIILLTTLYFEIESRFEQLSFATIMPIGKQEIFNQTYHVSTNTHVDHFQYNSKSIERPRARTSPRFFGHFQSAQK